MHARLSFASVAFFTLLAGCSGADDPSPGNGGNDAIADTAETSADVSTDTAVDSAETSTDAASTETATDAESEAEPPTDTGDVCTPSGLGTHCDDTNPCPTTMRCYGSGSTGFCAPFMPECGGFVAKKCPAGLACLYGPGADYGFCAEAPQKVCICGKVTGVDGC